MMKRAIIAATLVAMPMLASAQQGPNNYECTYGDLTRRVEIIYETGVTVPCEVHYDKDTEAPGEQQVLWRALNEEGYCESKTVGFVDKLRGLGWSCSAGDSAGEAASESPAEEAEPEMTDDTSALAPAEEEQEAEIEIR
jgi:hypothetical protein